MWAMEDGMEELSSEFRESSLFFYSVFRLGPRAEGVPRFRGWVQEVQGFSLQLADA